MLNLNFNRIFIAGIGLFTCLYGNAQIENHQQNKHQSINGNIFNEAKLSQLFALCDKWESFNPEKLKVLVDSAKLISQEVDNPQKKLIVNYYYSAYLFQKSKTDDALQLIEQTAKTYFGNYGYDSIYTRILNLEGNILLRVNKVDEMMKLSLDYLKQAEIHHDTINIARALVGAGNVNLRLNNQPQALSWYFKALNLLNNDEKRRKLSFLFNNLAITYYHLDKEDSVNYFVLQGIKYAEQSGNITNLANAWMLKGGMLTGYSHFTEAEIAFKNGIKLRKQIGDYYNVVADMVQLAVFYCNTGKSQLAVELCLEGLSMIEKYGHNYGNEIALYEALGIAYKNLGDFQALAEVQKQYINLQDSLFQQNTSETVAELQAKYDLQKKENLIMQQRFDLTQRNYLLIGLSTFSVLLILSAILLLKSYRRRVALRTALLMSEAKRATEQAVANAENSERKRIAADLHDSLGAYAASIASNIDNLQTTSTTPIFQDIRDNAQAIISELADTIWVLKRNELPLTAISDRLKSLIIRLRRSYANIEVDFSESIIQDIIFGPSQAYSLFQILSEALVNAVRHSKGNAIKVIITSNQYWEVCILDNGMGLLDTGSEMGGNGLENIKKRATEMNWSVEWLNLQNGGTKFLVSNTPK
ncbi:MAG: hypothetical protein JST52_04795 [Bacteroidetes bacterium]|nr:hypothetical protein [Bacteroidota bacterium]MBS1740579.1 hypothetical protein [Bacteroidota bacterium]